MTATVRHILAVAAISLLGLVAAGTGFATVAPQYDTYYDGVRIQSTTAQRNVAAGARQAAKSKRSHRALPSRPKAD